MIRFRSVCALVLAGALVTAAQAQNAKGRRGGPRGASRSSLIGLLGIEQVQKDLKLNEDQLAKVKTVTEEITAEMRKQYTALRDIQDASERRAKMTELSGKLDTQAQEKLGEALSKEQMTRLCQIRMQVRSAVESLSSKDVAEKLKLTEQQQKKVADIAKDVQAKRTELFRSLRDATQEQRTEAHQKYRKLREDADKEALAVLTAEQTKAFEAMKGKKIELPARGGRGGGGGGRQRQN